MNKNLSFRYFYQEDGELDPFTKLIDCFSAHLYFILKNKIEGIQNPYEVFLKDISFYLILNDQGAIYDIEFSDNSINEDVFRLKYYKGKGEEAFSGCREMLLKGEPVIIYTDTRKVPFFNDNQGEGTEPTDAGVQLGHVFLGVGYEGNNLYYVEAPWNINFNRFTPYKGNRSVGVIAKEELNDAFESFLTYTTVEVNEENLANKAGRIKAVIKNSVDNFSKQSHRSKGLTYFYGSEAIEKIIEVCEKEIMYLDRQAYSCSLNLFSLLDWRFFNINRRRILLLEALKKNKELFESSEASSAIDVLSINIEAWKRVLTTIRKMNIRKRYLMDSSLKDCLAEVSETESKLNDILHEMELKST
jgi:hypothetical protein